MTMNYITVRCLFRGQRSFSNPNIASLLIFAHYKLLSRSFPDVCSIGNIRINFM